MDMVEVLKTSYYLSKLVFVDENQFISELISVTEENIQIMNHQQVIRPVILSSYMRELTLEEAAGDGVPLNFNEMKVFITKQQAELLSKLENDPKSYIKLAYSLF